MKACALMTAALLAAAPAVAQSVAGPLVVYNAGSLALPFRDLLAAFAREHPGIDPQQESSGSLEAARKLSELGKIPDILAVADYGVIAKLLMPAHAAWYATFASNAMVLAYSARSIGAGDIDGNNWWRVLLRPGVRWGSSNPALDPNGYRAHMVFQLAERHYGQPGLARRLEAALRPEYVRPSEAQLLALVQSGELDYVWSYRSLAQTAGLKWVTLPPDVDLSDPARAAAYGAVSVRLPGPNLGGRDSLEFRGEPILYALTIPVRAPHPSTARAFVRFLFSAAGREILLRNGYRLSDRPALAGDTSAAAGLLPDRH
jgi:molybdate/tungstate transport system substrate-binding protein